MEDPVIQVKTVPTTPFKDQKMGTSGLRKKTSAVTEHKNYLPNFFQSVIETICELDFPKGYESSLVIGGDGRYYNDSAIIMLIEMILANAQLFLKCNGRNSLTLYVGQEGLFSTPAISNFIRRHQCGYGGFVLTASHNPGGMDGDFGFKYNSYNGGPSLEWITDKIYERSTKITQYNRLQDPVGLFIKSGLTLEKKNINFDFDVNIPTSPMDKFKLTVRVVDPCDEYVDMLKGIFDFEKIKEFFKFNPDFKCIVDSFNAVTGPYVKRIFWDEFKLQKTHQVSLRNFECLPNFGGKHPDPNLTYAKELVDEMMCEDSQYEFGCAFDGDGDRNMILGKNFFVTPSDSLAVIADFAARKGCIPFFDGKVKGVARSMPTSTAVDRVAKARGFQCFETPTGWKYFGNLMDAEKCSICGEESFGTGSDHIREKDGIWAVLAWLSIFAHEGHGNVKKIVEDHWKKYGRSFYERYDYEGVDTPKADKLFAHIADKMKTAKVCDKIDDRELAIFDDFEYKDIDGTVYPNRGIRMIFKDGSRIIFRQSGTGSVGTTIRVYLERVMEYTEPNSDKVLHATNDEICKPLGDLAIKYTSLINITGRLKPDVVT